MATTLISCYNEALALVGAGDIADIDEASIEARECNRFGPALLLEIGEWADWPFKVRRAALASVTNDRPAEWLYAYAPPSGLGQPIALRSVEDDATSLPENGPYPFPLQDAYPLRYLVEGGKIYANTETATLVYTSNVIEVGDLEPLVRRAFVDELAARIYMPIKKDPKITFELRKAAMMSKNIAIANEQNRSPRVATRYVSEAEYARMGHGV
jgi:hypothetical protein